MVGAGRDWAGAVARAAFDRAAFVVESFAVAVVVMAFLGFAAARFDPLATAYVWGLFWLRIADSEAVLRAPVLALLGLVTVVLTTIVAWVRWPKARRTFDAFPTRPRVSVQMLERLG